MSIKWRNKIFKAGIVSLAFLLTINPLDLNSVIRANEEVKEEKTVNSDHSINLNNNQGEPEIVNGNIDMRQLFFFKGIARKDNRLQVLNDNQIKRTASYIDAKDNIEKTDNIAKILTVKKVAGMDDDKQTVIGTSKYSLDLKRDFEIEASFSMKEAAHGFVFALHGKQGYQPLGTDDSLGVYYNKKESYTMGGLGDAFIMEVDTYNDGSEFGDKSVNRKKHVAYNETDANGGLKYDRGGYLLGNSLQHITTDTTAPSNLFTLKSKAGNNSHVRFVFRWEANSKHGSVTFKDSNLTRYNLTNRQINVLQKLSSRNNGEVYISIGGTTDWAGSDFMEIGVHRIKYNDLTPSIKTKIETENGGEVKAVYPGQRLKIKNYLYNTTRTPVDIKDQMYLHMLYLQFLNNEQISKPIPAQPNFRPEQVKIWIEDDRGNKTYLPGQDLFDESHPIPLIFPSYGKYFVLEYDIIVPDSVENDENYNKEFYLYFQTKVGQRGIQGLQIKEKHQVRLLPKIKSENTSGSPQIHVKHDVFKYYGGLDNGKAIGADVLHELWNKLYITSSVDRHVELNSRFTQTPAGTKINKKYFIHDNSGIWMATNNSQIPSRLSSSSSVTLVLEVIDAKLNNLKSYYYRTVVIADKFKLSNDGDYVIYGNDLDSIKETELNLKNKDQFSSYIKDNGNIKSLKRDSKDALFESSSFSVPQIEVDIKNDWIYNNKIDLNVNDNFSQKAYSINTFVSASRLTNINLNLNLDQNTIQKDDNKGNIANGTTSYIIIPSNINIITDPSNHDKIKGEGKIYLSDYSTRKKYHVWTDKTINLNSDNGKSVQMISSRVNGENPPYVWSGKEYIGIVNETKKVSNPLKLRLSGDRYKGPISRFVGNLTFYVQMIQ